jgi:hypothetical protein
MFKPIEQVKAEQDNESDIEKYLWEVYSQKLENLSEDMNLHVYHGDGMLAFTTQGMTTGILGFIMWKELGLLFPKIFYNNIEVTDTDLFIENITKLA